MRTAILVTCAPALLLLLSCKSDDKDPVTEQCETICTVDAAHACASRQSECILDCRSYGTKAQQYGGPKCATCVIGTYEYVVDPGGQCGKTAFVHKAELTPECIGSCLAPDGGAAGL
jgi:hypothetical protein